LRPRKSSKDFRFLAKRFPENLGKILVLTKGSPWAKIVKVSGTLLKCAPLRCPATFCTSTVVPRTRPSSLRDRLRNAAHTVPHPTSLPRKHNVPHDDHICFPSEESIPLLPHTTASTSHLRRWCASQALPGHSPRNTRNDCMEESPLESPSTARHEGAQSCESARQPLSPIRRKP
jgi:hypothetical protein